MADKVIGVDVGTNAVRAAEVALGAHPKLLRFGQVALPAGAVVEGEVVDGTAVADALRRLWREVGFKGKSVRVGIASARVILRIVEMPELSEDETRSALELQLGDYVPMAPESTMFGFQPIAGPDGWAAGPGAGNGDGGTLGADNGSAEEGGPGEDSGSRRRRVLLAAAHGDAVRPLVEAVQQAGLKVAAVDVIPAALARSLAPTNRDSVGPPPVEAIVSLGAGTTLVVVARGGTPLFARTITTVSGRQCTERLAEQLQVAFPEAERAKRLAAASGSAAGAAAVAAGLGLELADLAGPAGTFGARAEAGAVTADPAVPGGRDPSSPGGFDDDLAVPDALTVTRPLVAELVSEVADSLDYYGSQPGALTVDRVLLTGGGMRLADARPLLEERLGLPVSDADPYGRVEGVPAGFEPVDLPFLAPYLPAALGIALGGGRGRAARIDLLPDARSSARGRLPIVIGAVAAVVVLAVAFLYWQRRGEISRQEEAAATARQEIAQLAAAQSALADPAPTSSAETVLQAALQSDPDWLAAALRLDEISAVEGITVTELSGTMATRASAVASAGTTATSTTATTAGSTAGVATPATPVPEGPTVLGTLTVSGTAPGMQAIAAWLDSLAGDPRFTNAWLTGVTPVETPGATGVQFNAEIEVTTENLVARTLREVQQ